MTRVLVTGANGFVGPHLARALAARGHEVIGSSAAGAAPSGPFAAWATLDVLDRDALAAALAAHRPGAIVHLAGQSSAARSFEDPAGTFRLNVIGTWNVLDAARREAPAARILAVGSGEAYGPQPAGSRVAESEPFRPVSPYGLSKAASDQLAGVVADDFGLDVIRTRSFAHAGPGQAPTFALPSFAQQIAAIERGERKPRLEVGNLEVTRDLTDVRDVAEAYALLLERGERGAVNVGSGEGLRLKDVVERLAAMARVRLEIEVDPARFRPADVEWLVADVSRLVTHTDWSRHFALDQTLEDLLDAARTAPAAR